MGLCNNSSHVIHDMFWKCNNIRSAMTLTTSVYRLLRIYIYIIYSLAYISVLVDDYNRSLGIQVHSNRTIFLNAAISMANADVSGVP